MDNTHEITQLKNNLEAYKLLNRDLSKKVQELKLYLNQNSQILEVTRNELMQERVNNAKFQHFIKTNITMCSQFYSSVINNLNECILTTNLDVSISETNDPDRFLSKTEREQAGPSLRSSRLHEINKLCKNNAKNLEDILYTINEDQQSLSTMSIEDVQPTEVINESGRRSLRISTPNKSSCPALQEFQNITYIPTQPISPPINREDNTSLLSSNNSSTNLSFNSNNDTPRKSLKRSSYDPRRLSSSVNEPLQKNKSMSVELLAVSLTEQQLQEYLDKYDNYDDYDNESLFSNQSTTASTAASNASATTSTNRKNRVKTEIVKRKSKGRPKRKVALNVSLAEKSCRTKLRRSK